MESWDRVLRREVRQSARIAVIGVGNVSRGDDAAGALVARALLAGRASPPKTSLVLDAGDVPENFTGVIRVFKPDLVVIVDSARAGRPPGTVFLVDPADVAEEDISTHRIPLSRLARYVRETMGSRVLILGIEPTSLEEGSAVVPAVGRAVKRVARALRQALDTE
jgi:hydrogenase 3 maturation protease